METIDLPLLNWNVRSKRKEAGHEVKSGSWKKNFFRLERFEYV